MLIRKISSLFVPALVTLLLCSGSVGWTADETVARLSIKPDTDLVQLGRDLSSLGSSTVQLLPEGTVLVRLPSAMAGNLPQVKNVTKVEDVIPAAKKAVPAAPDPQSKGLRIPTAEEWAVLSTKMRTVTTVEPNALALQRAQLSAPSINAPPINGIDNSASIYFPPIRSQGLQGSCTTWATCYYYSTYLQAMDEGITVSGGDNDHICSPSFMYNQINGGIDNGSPVELALWQIGEVGCSSWSLMPYNMFDHTFWPSEAAWIDAIQRRSEEYFTRLGTTGNVSDAEFAAIKQHLANGYCGVTVTNVYENFDNDYPNNAPGIDSGVLFANNGALIAAHAMTLVGYDDDKSYNDGTGKKYGAFLIANSWGTGWGSDNSAGDTGYLWVSYDYFRYTPGCFGQIYYLTDRDDYRSKLYAVTGINHPTRNSLRHDGGVGTTSSAAWEFDTWFGWEDGGPTAIADDKRAAIDLNDGVPYIGDPMNIRLYTSLSVDGASGAAGTMTSADFYHDLDGNGTYLKVSSPDPTVTVTPGTTGYATVGFSWDGMEVTPDEVYPAAGPLGGPVLTAPKTYTVRNTGGTAISYSVSKSQPWIELTKTGGTVVTSGTDTFDVSINSNADALPLGTHTGTITVTNTGSGVGHTRTVELTIRGVHSFACSAVSSPQGVGAPFGFSLSAYDSGGQLVRGFDGTAALSAFYTGERTVGGSGSEAWYPFWCILEDARVQVIYLASEMGGGGTITSLALNVTQLPGQSLNNFTIRMKHTPLTYYAVRQWETSGWTVVYQDNLTLPGTGWYTFTFQTPFTYNGTDSLMVDFSFNNDYDSTSGRVAAATTAQTRAVYFGTLSDPVWNDPLTWPVEVPADPGPYVPQMQISIGGNVQIVPQQTDNFTDGNWTGNVSVLETGTGIIVRAEESPGHGGTSNSFDVQQGPVITNVTSSDANGTYGDGETLTISVEFSASVTVTGTPLLELETGDVNRTATYSGMGGASVMNFTYTISPGDNSPDLDYATSVALSLNGGSIVSSGGGVNPSLILPVPGAAGSLGTNKDLAIDAQPPISTASVSDSTMAGTTSLAVLFLSSDAHSAVASTELFARVPGGASFSSAGTQSGSSGMFAYTAAAGDGLYEFATKAVDTLGNAEADPTIPETGILLNVDANSDFTQDVTATSQTLVFPMTDLQDVEIALTDATPGSTITVSRTPCDIAAPAAFRNSAMLIDECLHIGTSGDLGPFTATLTWPFDPASASGLGGAEVNAVFCCESDAIQEQFSVTPSGSTLEITNITGFSTWFAGNGAAVPVNVSRFTVE